MNFFSFLSEYLSNERLKDILKHYQMDISGTNRELVEHLVSHEKFEINDFIKFLMKSELVNLSKVFKLRSTGNKSELWSNLSTKFTFDTEQFMKEQISKQAIKENESAFDGLESLFYEDVGSVLRQFADYGDFSKEEAIKKLKKKHFEVPENVIIEVFDYFHSAYKEVFELVRSNLDAYSGLGDNYWFYGKGKPRQVPDAFFPFELELSQKYPKIPPQMLRGLLEFHFFWHYLK